MYQSASRHAIAVRERSSQGATHDPKFGRTGKKNPTIAGSLGKATGAHMVSYGAGTLAKSSVPETCRRTLGDGS